MATIFRNLFRHKKSQSKEDAGGHIDNGATNEDGLERDTSRRSYRSSKHRSTRFADDNMLPPTAAYHTTNAPKLKKGPQSCPGGYGEELELANSRSFPVDTMSKDRRSRHHNNGPSSSSTTGAGAGGAEYHHHYHNQKSTRMNNASTRYPDPFYSRWETSEYGSENTSPIASSNHRHHYEPQLDVDDDEEFEYDEQNKFQSFKQRYRRRFEEKLNEYEARRRDDRRKIKELEKEKLTIEKEKNDVVKIMIQQNDKLEKEKKKVDYYKRKLLEMEQQINQFRGGFGGFGMFPTTPHQHQHHHQQQQTSMFPSFGSTSTGPSQRFSFMSSSIRPISSSNTPTTSAMDTSGGGGGAGGAGESLVPASDLSLVQIPPMQNIHIELPTNVPTGGPIIGHFDGFHDDEEDETKNFRTTETPASSIEMPRSSSVSFLKDSILNESNLSTLAEVKDEGYSTTPESCNSKIQEQQVKLEQNEAGQSTME